MIYKLNNKELRNKMKKFGKTTYGKCMFIICFNPFIILFILSIILLLNMNKSCMIIPFLITIFLTIIAFSIGNYGYYKELREYINTQEK